MLERLGREELNDDEEEAWNILVNCDNEGSVWLNQWLVKCRNNTCRYVLCTNVCTHVCLGFVFSFLGLCVLIYAND